MPARRSISRTLEPLRLAFHRAPAAREPDAAPAPPSVPDVDFVAYAEDCILSGRIGMAAERISDLLNAHDRFELVDVLVTPLGALSAIESRSIVVERDEILAVHASGPRGNAARRQRTRQHPIVVSVGPYEIHGYVHATPGADPIASFRRRKPMVALTDARILFTIMGQPQVQAAATVVVNRENVDWVVEGSQAEVLTLDLPTGESGPLTKDFTGELFRA
jgi:hypothetical protein